LKEILPDIHENKDQFSANEKQKVLILQNEPNEFQYQIFEIQLLNLRGKNRFYSKFNAFCLLKISSKL
jgi:hypothetical protein